MPYVQDLLKFARRYLLSYSVPKFDNWYGACAASGAEIYDLNVKEKVGKTEILTWLLASFFEGSTSPCAVVEPRF